MELCTTAVQIHDSYSNIERNYEKEKERREFSGCIKTSGRRQNPLGKKVTVREESYHGRVTVGKLKESRH